VHIAEKFESLLERYRREDGGRWTGQDLDEATGGVVTRSYVSTLRKGRIENPGFEKLRAIAKAMGFPPELWFEEGGLDGTKIEKPDGEIRLSERVEHLFETAGRARTGEPYTSAEVARLTVGDLTEDEIAGIREGRIEDPSVGQIRALADAFGISPAYFLHGTGRATLVDEESLRALGDEKSRRLLLESFGLTGAEKDMLLDMIEHLKVLRGPGETD
jgi:transcriptional regulator with XRE-family HTH domain